MVTVCQTAVSVVLPLGLATNSHNVLDTVAFVPQVVPSFLPSLPPPSLPPFLALQEKAFFWFSYFFGLLTTNTNPNLTLRRILGCSPFSVI